MFAMQLKGPLLMQIKYVVSIQLERESKREMDLPNCCAYNITLVIVQHSGGQFQNNSSHRNSCLINHNIQNKNGHEMRF